VVFAPVDTRSALLPLTPTLSPEGERENTCLARSPKGGRENTCVGAQFTEAEAKALGRYFTNLDRPVFALRNLPEVVKGALFSRYSRTEKSLRRVLLDEFINEPESGFERLAGGPASTDDDMVAVRRAEEFYERVLVGYGDDSVAELAGAHVAVEEASILAAKALEDSRIGISPLEKSTRYVRFDRPGRDGRYLYHRGPELRHSDYEPAADALFATYRRLVEPVTSAMSAAESSSLTEAVAWPPRDPRRPRRSLIPSLLPRMQPRRQTHGEH